MPGGWRIQCRLVASTPSSPSTKTIVRAAKETGGIVVLEEHNLQGGVGSAVAEVLMDEGCGNVPFKRLALPDVNVTKVGSQAWLRDQYGLSVADVVNAVREMVK